MSDGDVQTNTEMVKTAAPKPRVSHFNPTAVVPMEETRGESLLGKGLKRLVEVDCRNLANFGKFEDVSRIGNCF